MLLLCTDLDRTLIPNGAEPESPAARPRFRRLAASGAITLAYVTGRHPALVEQAIRDYGLPWPDYLISDVGTRLQALADGEDGDRRWLPVPDWDERIARDWPGPAALQTLLADLPGLRPQEPQKQTPLKLSYYVSLAQDRAALLAAIEARLAHAGHAVNLVWSIDEAAAVGLLDLLPAGAGKYQSIAFLLRQVGATEQDTVFAGDSGNDLDVLVSPIPSVLVANAHPEVREQASRLAAEQGLADRLYCARGGWQGMNGNYGAGILEGVAHFRPDLAALVDP